MRWFDDMSLASDDCYDRFAKIWQVGGNPSKFCSQFIAKIWTAPPQPSLVDDVVSCFNTSTETELSCQHELCNSVPKLSVHPSRNSPCLHVFWNLFRFVYTPSKVYFIHSRYHIYIYTYKTFQGGSKYVHYCIHMFFSSASL